MKCSCNHTFAPTPATYYGPQLFTDGETGAVWLYLILHRCPACGSTRALVMFCGEPDEESESEEQRAAE